DAPRLAVSRRSNIRSRREARGGAACRARQTAAGDDRGIDRPSFHARCVLPAPSRDSAARPSLLHSRQGRRFRLTLHIGEMGSYIWRWLARATCIGCSRLWRALMAPIVVLGVLAAIAVKGGSFIWGASVSTSPLSEARRRHLLDHADLVLKKLEEAGRS